MDKISKDEIERALNEYEKNAPSSNVDSTISSSPSSPLSDKQKKSGKKDLKADLPPTESLLFSSEFRQFEKENKPAIHSWYEKVCSFCGNLIKISPGNDRKADYIEALSSCHLNVSPEDAFAFAIIGPALFMILGILVTFMLLNGDLFFMAFFLLSGIGIMIPLTKLPFIFASIWRIKSSKEIVLSIFYIVTYMRQNSNLEKAIEFAGDHLTGPLSLELKKVLWDVESQIYGTIKESIDTYIEKWRKSNSEFIEAMNLIESSLYEPIEQNRIALLDKSLDVILTGTYEKMLHYSHDIQSPISTLHMLGVILPILGLVILPLVVSFMENVAWYHIAILYDVVIPVIVYFVGKNILSTRPGGYGGTEISEDNPLLIELKRKNKKFLGIKWSPLAVALIVAIPLFIIGIMPLVLHSVLPAGTDIVFFKTDNPYRWYHNYKALDYRESKTLMDDEGNPAYKGPYGLIATIMGICIILSLGLGTGTYYYLKSKDAIIIREHTKKLEDEFGSAIFQLGNRLGDGIPLEMSFSKVVTVMKDSEPGKFFGIVDQNIRRLGMSPEQAIFDERLGAIQFFPSNIILSTMKVLTEAIKKGPLVAARAMNNVARYVKEMHSVEERLKDLLAEVISSMNSLIKFLAPVISGIVVGITAMITNIIGTLSTALKKFSANAAGSEGGALSGLVSMFGDGIPTYHFQIVVGLYIVEVVYIISQTINGISNGDDKTGENYTIGTYLLKTTVLYALMSAIVMTIFNIIVLTILQKALQSGVV